MNTIVALFHTQSEADAAVHDLLATGVSADRIAVAKNQELTGKTTPTRATDQPLEESVKQQLGLGVAERDAYHAEPARDGGFILTVKSEEAAGETVDTIQAHQPFDLIIREGDWSPSRKAG